MMRTMQLVRVAGAVALLAGWATGAIAQNSFLPATGTYQTDGNWSAGHVPTGGEQMRISDVTLRTATYSSATDYTTTGRFLIGHGGLGELIVSADAGTLTFGGDNFNSANYVGVGTNGEGTLTMNGGTITLTGAAGLNVAGNNSGATGTVTINSGATMNIGNRLLIAANDATTNGTVTLNGGTLTIGTGSGAEQGYYRSGSGTSTLNLDAGTLSLHLFYGSASGAINFNGATVRAMIDTPNFTFSSPTLNVRDGGAILDTNDHTITAAAPFVNSGSGGLTKVGDGTLTLSAASTYIGLTTIGGGTLTLTSGGSIDNTSGVAIASGATLNVAAKVGGYTVESLSGSGAVEGWITVADTLAIGSSPGTMEFDDLTLAGSSTYLYEVVGGTNDADLGNVSGFLDLDGAALSVTQLGTYTLNDKYTLFGYNTDELTGTFADLANGDTFLAGGGFWQIQYADDTSGLNGGTGDLFVTITAVPEPGAIALLAAGCLSGIAILRRRTFPAGRGVRQL